MSIISIMGIAREGGLNKGDIPFGTFPTDAGKRLAVHPMSPACSHQGHWQFNWDSPPVDSCWEKTRCSMLQSVAYNLCSTEDRCQNEITSRWNSSSSVDKLVTRKFLFFFMVVG